MEEFLAGGGLEAVFLFLDSWECTCMCCWESCPVGDHVTELQFSLLPETRKSKIFLQDWHLFT